MSERAMRGRVCRALRSLDAISIENPVYPGTPDVNYIGGWIELKQISSWPVRKTTPLRVHHFTQQQRVWLRRRWEMGGKAYLLLQIGQEFLLFTGSVAAELLGNSTQATLRNVACKVWEGKQMDKEIAECLSRQKI